MEATSLPLLDDNGPKSIVFKGRFAILLDHDSQNIQVGKRLQILLLHPEL
jgi:hypothetical protein